MAGIGVKLNKIYNKNTITTDLIGFGYSTVITIAPMFLVIASILAQHYLLGYKFQLYVDRELFAVTVLYIFIFALLTASPFNAVLSKYLSDVIFNETYEDILPCFYTGLGINIILGSIVCIPFCIHEYVVGEVEMSMVLGLFFGYMGLLLVFYSMLFLSICKAYKMISLFFLIGALVAIILALVFRFMFGAPVMQSMLYGLDIGFLVTSSLEYSIVRSYFRENSGKYKEVLQYMGKYKALVLSNFFYILGLYIHNFIFWTTEYRVVVAKSFVHMIPYDMATCLAMFTNISASMIFISRVEMNFHERYKQYSEAVIGGRGMDIRNTKRRMFSQVSEELMSLTRLQFIISVVMFLLFEVILPRFGFGGLVMQIYPCLAAGYFVLFLTYSMILFLYYFNDYTGALITSLLFVVTTGLGTVIATNLTPTWWGIGVLIGSVIAFVYSYLRVRKVEREMDVHTFCKGSIMKSGIGKQPSNCVYTHTFGSGKQDVVTPATPEKTPAMIEEEYREKTKAEADAARSRMDTTDADKAATVDETGTVTITEGGPENSQE